MANELQLRDMEQLNIDALKRARATIKGKITRLENFIHQLSPDEEYTIESFETRLQDLRLARDSFEAIQSQIESVSDDTDEENENQREQFEEHFYRTETLYNRAKNRYTAVRVVQQISSEPSDTASANHQQSTLLPELRLPSFTLPKFNGSIEDYHGFKELFKSLIEESRNLSPVTMYHYLKSAVTGPAAAVIRCLPATGNNYYKAWELLDNRYECRATVIEKMNLGILNLPSIQSESAAALRTLLDDFTSNMSSLEALAAEPDSIFVAILMQKIDSETKKQFKLSFPSKKQSPTLSEFINFIEERIGALNAIAPTKKDRERRTFTHQAVNVTSPFRQLPFSDCMLCNSNTHRTPQCEKYKAMSIQQREDFVQSKKLCFNCLSNRHRMYKCTSNFKCHHCNKLHHTSLHHHKNDVHTQSSPPAATTLPAVTLFGTKPTTSHVLLSTASVLVQDVYGRSHTARALLDSASQSNFITSSLATKLQLPRLNSELKITGIGRSKNLATQRVITNIKSRTSSFNTQLEFFILPRITDKLPHEEVDTRGWRIPPNLQLADEEFDIPKEIDLLIGAQLFFKILYKGHLPANHSRPAIQHTRFGWIFGGPIPHTRRSSVTAAHLSLSEQVERFWKIDECAQASTLTAEEEACEDHFLATHLRNSDGRYTVSLPFRQPASVLGTSRNQARRRWLSVEARLKKNPDLQRDYQKFMIEYLSLGHMTRLGSDTSVPDKPEQYFIPHHAVFKADSSSTRVRVVFDASMKTSSGLSLNDILMVGPTVQEELFNILLRFRKHKYVFVADITKMYRQVQVLPPDCVHQLIFWREDPSQPLDIYQLNTVTYGTASAPYLATRCLKQIAIDEGANFPLAAQAIHDFYVDDFISGNDSYEIALHTQQQMTTMLSKAGFHLRKWVSNCPSLLEQVPPEECEPLNSRLLTQEPMVKTLGLRWIPTRDMFCYDVSSHMLKPATTKRQVLSQLASLFDPLGLLGPVICAAKIFVQQLWREKLTWDQPMPEKLSTQWRCFSQSLSHLPTLHIPRHASGESTDEPIQLHGFADASEQAYGCAIYLRSPSEKPKINLLCSKSRVAPQKQLTLPRLELCAALLLVRLMITVISALKIPNIQPFCWSDSTIVLSWINSPSHQWKTFVANRVAEIQGFHGTWNHVSSADNPADIISRGSTLDQLQNSSLWWTGPNFLRESFNPTSVLPSLVLTEEMPEQRSHHTTAMVSINNPFNIFTRFSKLRTLVNVTAWCLRFIKAKRFHSPPPDSITPEEREEATRRLITLVQREASTDEVEALKKGLAMPKRSSLQQLTPFLDTNGIIRVGGRLQHKHPILLPPKHPLTRLIILNEHQRCLHGGPQLVLALLRQQYWIVNVRSIVRQVIHKCIRCFRVKPTNTNHLMGKLPTIRTEQARPFIHTGIDFAGPFMLKPPIRSRVVLKHYVALFVCMTTKAIHLETVSGLTTEAFIAALNRFTSRRGLCSTISCDNATNFRGAHNQLREIYAIIRKGNAQITESMATKQIKWIFSPPLAPHWGGLWEAGVKSFKFHLKRIAGTAALTYEEFSTILCTIEACLNSRPITPMSTDPNDFEALTPGHFLIGEPLLSVPAADVTSENINRLTRWHRIQAISQHIWKRWSVEYLSTLIPLSKWRHQSAPPVIGQLALIKEDNLPPLQWRLGRIIQVHPGSDGTTRVATLKTQHGQFTRHVNRVFPLPMEEQPTN